jgi:hypothetical protein
MKHIYKYSVEASFFKLMTSENEVTKEIIEGKPAIRWRENETTVCSWSYDGEDGEKQRDNDYYVVVNAYHLLKVYRG